MEKENRTYEVRGSAPREEESRLKTQKKISAITTDGDRTHEVRGSAPRGEVKQKNLRESRTFNIDVISMNIDRYI